MLKDRDCVERGLPMHMMALPCDAPCHDTEKESQSADGL